MKYLINVRKRVEKNIITRIRRDLKGKGKINVRLNQEVTPSDIIGTSFISSGFRSLNLASLLSVSPSKVGKFLKKGLGQRIYKDELLAYKSGGFFSKEKVVTSPTDGTLDYLNPATGEVRMTFLPKRVDLPSGVYGIVDFVDPNHGQVVIRTLVSRIYGMFGSGRVKDGNLVLFGRREGLISENEVSLKYEGHILVGGSLIFKDGISQAISSNVSGIITGGINAQDFRGMAGGRLVFPNKFETDIGISLLVCEGFGSIPIGEDIYQLLSIFEGKFISIDGNKAIINLPSFESKSMIKVRSVQLPPILENVQNMEEGNQAVRVGELKIGVFVRVVGNTFAGEQGKVLAIDKSETLLPSGVRSYLVTIETKRRKIKVPVANIEIIDYSFSS